MGFFNVTSILALLIALERVPGVVVFPVQASGGLLLNTLFAAVFWHERFVRRTLVGMGIAGVGLALVNLK
jgi:drug/metabolite transporter (DMT)-like permease